MKVDPGAYMTVREGNVYTTRYWQPPTSPIYFSRSSDYAEALGEKLDRAVKDRLRRLNGPLATQLSGGLDSSSVTATAAALLRPGGETLHAITAIPRTGYTGAVPPGTFAHEGTLAAETAAKYANVIHHSVYTGEISPIAGLDRDFELYQRPLLNLENFAWVVRTREVARAQGSTVMLTGSMGNMSISYHGLEALPDLLGKGRLPQLFKLCLALARWGFPFRSSAVRAFGPFVPHRIWTLVRRARRKSAALTDYAALSKEGLRLLEASLGETSLGGSFRPSASGLDVRLNVLAKMDPGNYNKGALAGWGLDVRDPTADKRLMEYCLSVPSKEFLHGGVPRSLIRRAMREKLPASVLNERRKGYQAADWHERLEQDRGALAKELGRLRLSPSASELLDIERLERLVQHWPSSGWSQDLVRLEYRSALLRGISAGHFLALIDGTSARR
jgi:asparagine synthase (glutamine-hydrolysing)